MRLAKHIERAIQKYRNHLDKSENPEERKALRRKICKLEGLRVDLFIIPESCFKRVCEIYLREKFQRVKNR